MRLRILVLALAAIASLTAACVKSADPSVAPAIGACTKDSDCSGNLICEGGSCVAPAP